MKTVLLIDDDQACREPVAALLREGGWTVHEAADGKAGLEAARRVVPDAIVCDLLMPLANGFQLCHAVRQERTLKNTKIIVLTGRDYPTDRQIAEEVGADEYLVKPLQVTLLSNALERLTANGSGNGGGRTGNTPDSEFTPLENASVKLKFWGVRGSTPTPGPQTVKFGGNTSCVEVRADGKLIVLDAGSGMRVLGQSLMQEYKHGPLDLTVLLTHTHWDHIQGFPFFQPAYKEGNRIKILGYESVRKGLRATLEGQMESPYFPVSIAHMAAKIEIEELKEMDFQIGSIPVKACHVNHPDVCVGYRLFTSGGSICYIPDHESSPDGFPLPGAHVPLTMEKKFLEFIHEADVLIIDSQYTLDEYRTHIGWGHGCLEEVVRVAKAARVKQLFLFHHDPAHDDEFVEEMVLWARELAAGSGLRIDAAREGELITLGVKV